MLTTDYSDIAKVLSNYHVEDSPSSSRAHLARLGQAGFTSADITWKKHNSAVYVGIAAAQ